VMYGNHAKGNSLIPVFQIILLVRSNAEK
jgi:hypothetical protein